MFTELMQEVEDRLSAGARKTLRDVLDVRKVSSGRLTALRDELGRVARADVITEGDDPPAANASMQACELIRLLLHGLDQWPFE